MSNLESNPFHVESPPEAETNKESKNRKKSGKEKKLGAFLIKPEARDTAAEPVEKKSVFETLLPKKEGKETAEHEPLEKLSADEIQLVEQEIARAKLAGVENPDETGTFEEGYESDKVEAFYEKIADEHKDTEQALQETLADIQYDGIIKNPEAEEGDAVEPAEDTPDKNASEKQPDNSGVETADDSEADDNSVNSGNPVVLAGGGSGGGRMPPVQPPASEAVPPQPPSGRSPFAPLPPFAPAAAMNTAPAAQSYEQNLDSGNPAAAALVGGIVGYLVGRRRGRVKTEKKLKPVQKKLEKQVTNLQYQLAAKELQIRHAARTKAYEIKAAERIAVSPVQTPERGKKEPARSAAPEVNVLHASVIKPERIGKVVFTAEAAGQPQKAKQPEAPKLTVKKHVEKMSRAELLAVSDKIIIEGSSLRQIYESHLVGERGLRRLISEHLRGGNLKRALRREIVEREIDFERDPVMRDLSSQSGAVGGGASVSPKLQELVAKATSHMPSETDEVAFLKARAKYEERQKASQKKQQQALDVSMAGTILLLVVVIAVLLIRQS